MSRDLLRVRGLTTRFFTEEGQVNAVEDVSFTVTEGEVYGLVGESGAGKSVTALSLMDLVETPGRITDGQIWYRAPELAGSVDDPDAVDGEFVDLRSLSEGTRRTLRGTAFSMIFQDPMSSFNPSVKVGKQIAEAVEVQRQARANPRSVSARTDGYGLGSLIFDTVVPGRDYISPDSLDRAVELLEQVGIPDPVARADEYPHQFSGGMLQRAMIAQALAGEPSLLIADEPTTALDVTIQAQILSLLKDLQSTEEMSIVLITHDLGVISQMSDTVGVMYAGEIIEKGTLEDIFASAVHPYTSGLLGSIPDLDDPEARLSPIEGNVPSLIDEEMEDRCYFADRCPKAMQQCLEKPPRFDVESGRVVESGESGDQRERGRVGSQRDEGHTTRCYLAVQDYQESEPLPAGYFDKSGDEQR
ncbi:MAG: ABC transporter ATP-binding protein [Halodesulfurarchaeum sp.]